MVNPVRVFLEQIVFELMNWVKITLTLSVRIVHSTVGLMETKRQRKGEFVLCLSWDMLLLLPRTLMLLVLGP